MFVNTMVNQVNNSVFFGDQNSNFLTLNQKTFCISIILGLKGFTPLDLLSALPCDV